MRLFVALDLSDATRAHVRHVRAALEHRLAAARRVPRVTWVAEQSAHVTLRFIGEVADDVAERVRAALANALPVAPYEVEFSGLGAFPNTRRPRALWIGAATGETETEHLTRAVNSRLNPIVGPGESRPFRAHLTIGRIKEPGRFDWDAAFASVDVDRTATRIDHVTLYQSKTTPNGPTYTALSVTPLREPSGR